MESISCVDSDERFSSEEPLASISLVGTASLDAFLNNLVYFVLFSLGKPKKNKNHHLS